MKSNQRRERLEERNGLSVSKRKSTSGLQVEDSVRGIDSKLNSAPQRGAVKSVTAIIMNSSSTFNQASNESCAIQNNKSSPSPLSASPLIAHKNSSQGDQISLIQSKTMYSNITCTQLCSNGTFKAPSILQLARRPKAPTTSSSILYDRLCRPSAMQAFVLIASLLLLPICTSIVQTQAAPSDQDASQVPAVAKPADAKALGTSERSDSASGSGAAAAPSAASSSSSSPASSIVASLSSAVASAAAAAAVAAAQSSLTGSDARSLLSSSSSSSSASGGHHQAPRSPGHLLAYKLVDSIPEVPYSILHNMKKLDHAAPFYNVGNKVLGAGAVKESSHNLLSSALSASGGIGAAADQLTSLFRSPIWKRLADGYGEFTSEFRSLFRAPAPMKGPLSPSTKLLRDISVPAFLLLLASAMPSEWRPMKTRRKSALSSTANEQTPPLDPMTMAAAEQAPSFSNQQLFRPNFNLLPFQQPQQQQLSRLTGLEQFGPDSNRLARAGDISLSPADATSGLSQWFQTAAGSPALPVSQPTDNLQQPIRRLGDSNVSLVGLESDGKHKRHEEDHTKPVKSDHRSQSSATASSPSFSSYSSSQANQQQPSLGLFGSLTSSLANAAEGKLMNRLMNANSGGNQNKQLDSYRMLNLADEQRMSLLRAASKDQLSDKHRYSLLANNDGLDSDSLAQFGNLNEKLTPPSKPLLSAVSQAVSATLGSAPVPRGSGSLGLAIDDKTLLRRQQTGGSGAEQRDLTQLLPQSWKEVVKRTVNNVKQEASTQWRSIEGQLTNWVQDKLKTLPIAQASGSSPASVPSPASPAPSPVSNLLASVGSTALNILGIGNKNSSSSPAVSSPAPAASESVASTSAEGSPRNKDEANKAPAPSAKSALVGVANMIVNSLTRPAPASGSTAKPKHADDSTGGLISQYPTLTGAQPTSKSPASTSAAAGSTAAAVAQSIATS